MGNDKSQNAVGLDTKKLQEMSVADVYAALNCSDTGLTAADAKQRLEQYGLNALEEKKVSPITQFLRYFWGPIPWMIEIAILLSLVVQHWMDLIFISSLLVFNACIGFWEEHKASNALEALKGELALQARTLRDGKWEELPAAEIVPGDVVRLRMGDVIPADTKLIEGDYISIDQAALTGESLPVSKKIGDVAYSGSIAKQGEMSGLVTATGSNTFFGQTAKLVEGAGAVSHFQKAVMRVGDFLIAVSVGLSILLIIVELFRHVPILQMMQFILILVIASIPVAMPAVLSVTMALGALALSKRKAIVSRLQAIEEMAGVDILCSDKTGTLTQNKLTLGDPIVLGAKDPDDCILAGALASKPENKDAIDLAVIGGLKDTSQLDAYKQTKFVPFDPVLKRTEGVVTCPDGAVRRFTKGAPQVIMGMCDMELDVSETAKKSVADLAAKGYRTLGIAKAEGESGDTWKFLGILPLFDPPREDSKETIAAAKDHGIDVKMVTGDNTAIGAQISGQLGMGTQIQPAGSFFADGTDPNNISDEVAQRIETADGFAEVFPEHKYGIVKALQKRGHIVAMTGDGVNDAPALKQADTGVAVSGATDAARAAAAIILTLPGLNVIITAVQTARQIFERMLSYTIYRIAMTIDIMFFVVLAMLCYPHDANGNNFQPLTAVMIILLALLDDIPIMTIAYDNTYISKKPVRWEMKSVLTVASVLGVLSVVETFGLLAIIREVLPNLGQICGASMARYEQTVDPAHQQTMLFLQLVAGGHLMMFLTRTRKSFWRRPFPSWQLFWAIVATQVFAILLCGFGWGVVEAMPWYLIGWVWVYNFIWMFILDAAKLLTYRAIDHAGYFRQRRFKRASQSLHHFGALHNRK
ncbi:MAG: plasma-membrane proton-efflux P-type ATPase [Phycisphaerae bacterium]|nr:plasma-membrane proton-efflux P-type ATPase [Phycisphaerae bacterium]